PDLLAEAVGVDELVGADGDLVEARQQAELGQLLDGMRQRVDANAELADRVRLLENLTVDASRVQHQGCSQATDSAANNDRLHVRNPETTLTPGYRRQCPSCRPCAQRRLGGRVSGGPTTGPAPPGRAAIRAVLTPMDRPCARHVSLPCSRRPHSRQAPLQAAEKAAWQARCSI